jgi:hypothetical protein
MGINDEYSRDAYNYDLAYDSDGSDEFDTELHPEDWQDMYSQELLDGWMKIRDYMEERYLETRAQFPNFVDLVVNPVRWYSAEPRNEHHETMWSLISNLPVIRDRVQAENFYGWAKNYMSEL